MSEPEFDIQPRENNGAYQVTYFWKTLSANSSNSKIVRSRKRERDIFLRFDGESWVFQGCKFGFENAEQCQAYINAELDILISKLSNFLESQ